MEKVTNYILIKSNSKLKMSPGGDFFNAWVESLHIIHSLSPGEQATLAALLKLRYNLCKTIPENVVDKILLSTENRKTICKWRKIKSKHLNVTLTAFRHKGILDKNNKLLLQLVPVIHNDGVRLMIDFSFKNEPQLVKLGPQADSAKA